MAVCGSYSMHGRLVGTDRASSDRFTRTEPDMPEDENQ